MLQDNVAPESLTPEGIVPFSTPSFVFCSSAAASILLMNVSMEDMILLISSSSLSISFSFSCTSDANSWPMFLRSSSVIAFVLVLKIPSRRAASVSIYEVVFHAGTFFVADLSAFVPS